MNTTLFSEITRVVNVSIAYSATTALQTRKTKFVNPDVVVR